MREILASIDVGSSKIKMVVAEIIQDKINVLCALDEDSRGVVKGKIVEPDETEYAIKRLLKKVEENLGIKITKVIVGIDEERAVFRIGEASISITENDLEILPSDIVSVLQTSVKGQIDEGYDLVTVIPIMFKVDDKKTRIPRGMKGRSLSVKSVVVSAPKKDIYGIAKSLEKCGLEVIDIMFSSIGDYYAHKNESTDTETGVVIDMGAETIKISVFNKGIIINNIVLEAGGINIDSDIGYIYKLNDDDCKKIKESLGLASRKHANEKEVESLVNLLGEKVNINQYELTEIIVSRLREMLNMAKNEINYLTKKEISYIIITGGLSELKDFDLEVESVFGSIASVGRVKVIGARDNKYAACIGMLKYFDQKLKLRDKDYSILSQEDLDTLSAHGDKKSPGDSILGKVFGIFFDN